jgi:hypothetical protein
MKNIPFMYMVGYDQSFQKACKTGWGCGYVAIPMEHPVAVNHFKRIESDKLLKEANVLINPEQFYYHIDKYLNIPECEQEITLTEPEEINGKLYLTVGFDTAHSHNSSKDNFSYVFKETQKMLHLINNMNHEDK